MLTAGLMSDERRTHAGSPFTTTVVVVMVVLGLAVVLIAVLPVATCPLCEILAERQSAGGPRYATCGNCNGKGKVTPLARWRWQKKLIDLYPP